MHANGWVHVEGKGHWCRQTGRALGEAKQPQAFESQTSGRTEKRGRGSPEFTFLKKGIRFSFARGDMTVFGLALGERRLTGSSLSSGSKPVASMSMATHTDRQEHHHRGEHRRSRATYHRQAQNVANETGKIAVMTINTWKWHKLENLSCTFNLMSAVKTCLETT